MIVKYQKKYSVWFDVSMPSVDEVEEIRREHNLNASIANDLLNPTPKSKVSASGDKLYAVVHIPVFKHSHLKNKSYGNEQELDFVIGRKLLITVRYDSIDALYKYAKASEVNEMLEREEGGNHTFVEIMLEIYKSLFDELSYIEDRLKEIETKIFQGHEKEMVLSISNVGRDLLNFRRIIESHGEIFEELKMAGTVILGKKFENEVDELLEEWQRLEKSAENHTAFIHELRETNNSLLSTKQNETMKMLTIIAFVTLPASLIASIFNMSTSLPLVGQPYDFEIV
ncbi:MAG: CorA family divalent cation transporter, partial [Patescibacteria group bacterium]